MALKKRYNGQIASVLHSEAEDGNNVSKVQVRFGIGWGLNRRQRDRSYRKPKSEIAFQQTGLRKNA